MDKNSDSVKDLETQGFYKFGGFRLNLKKRRLMHGENIVALTPKEFEVLLYLVENAGRVAEKDEILDAVWKEVYVEETTLARNVSWLRQKLAAADQSVKLIETVPKRGYRFTAEVIKFDRPEIIIEKETLTHITIEETISLESEKHKKQEKEILPSNVPAENEFVKSFRLPKSSFPFLTIFGGLAVFALSILTVYWILFKNTESKISINANVVPFSGAFGYENTPAFSPDGQQLAFAWNNNGESEKTDIYVQLIGAGEPVRLTDTKIGEHYPTFSPDGKHIAFVREFENYGEVILIPALGGAERRVARLFSGNYSISFSPDGESIAVIDTPDSAPDKQYAVYLVNLKSGERKRLTVPAEFLGETTPRFSPDGKSLAFVRVFAGYLQDLFIISTVGESEPKQITFDRATIHSLAWSADGKDIFFVSTRESNRANIWRVAATGSKPEMLATGGRGITNIAASPDGKKIAFVENSINSDIFRLYINELLPQKFVSTIYNEESPQVSPDGNYILFLSNRAGKREVWMAEANGKNVRQLTDSQLVSDYARLSPDGINIVFSNSDNENREIFIQNIENGALRQLTFDKARNVEPEWSADGRWIYFTSDRTGEPNIWRTAADGTGEAIQITYLRGEAARAAPDGKTIYYSKKDSPDLWRTTTDGDGEEQIIPEFAAAGFSGTWTLTRTGIYFSAKNMKNLTQIKFYDFSDKTIKLIVENPNLPDKFYGLFDTSADGKFFLFSLQDQNASNIMFAEIVK